MSKAKHSKIITQSFFEPTLPISIHKFYPGNSQAHGSEILINFSLKSIGPHLVQHVAELMIYFGKEYGFIEPGGILKGDEFHELPIFSMYCFACHQSADGGQFTVKYYMEGFESCMNALK